MQKISALLHRFPRWFAMGAGAASAADAQADLAPTTEPTPEQ